MMKKIIMFILLIFVSGSFFCCSKNQVNIPLKNLLPDLSDYGFEKEFPKEFTEETLAKSYKNAAQESKFPKRAAAIEKQLVEDFPASNIFATYKKDNMDIFIVIYALRKKIAAMKIISSRLRDSKRTQSFVKDNLSLLWTIKKVKVNKHTAYYQIIGLPAKQKYQTKLFWSKGQYVFDLSCRGKIWPESEAIKIAEKIKY